MVQENGVPGGMKKHYPVEFKADAVAMYTGPVQEQRSSRSPPTSE